MESEKDIKGGMSALPLKRDNLSAFIDGNPLILLVVKKTQKFTAALHLLTGLLEKDNHFRISIRQCSVELLSHACGIAVNPDNSDSISLFRNKAVEILLFVESACFAGLISEMNAKVFQNEFLPILELLAEAAKDERILNPVVAPGFFENGAVAVAADLFGKRHIRHDDYVQYMSDKNIVHDKKSRVEDKGSSPGVAKESPRIEIILSLAKKKTELSVKDISAVVSGVSEKTIQRDLLSLVAKGVFKKKGERRWSRYSLARDAREV